MISEDRYDQKHEEGYDEGYDNPDLDRLVSMLTLYMKNPEGAIEELSGIGYAHPPFFRGAYDLIDIQDRGGIDPRSSGEKDILTILVLLEEAIKRELLKP